MAYPDALDVLRADLDGADRADEVDHAGLHNAAAAAVMAVQGELGVVPSGVHATVRARLDAVDADPRWSDQRSPVGHKTSHASGGVDALTPADIGAATSTQGAKADTAVQPARQIAAGAGLTGGGSLAADRTIAVAAGGVGTVQLADGSVTSAKVALSAVGSSAIADGAVTSEKIADGAIMNVDIAANAAIDVSKISPQPVTFSVVDAKGDLLAGTANDSVARVPVGADGTSLVADSTQTAGVGWVPVGNLLTPNQASGGQALGTTDGFLTTTASGVTSLSVDAGGIRVMKNTASVGSYPVLLGGTRTSTAVITPTSGVIPVTPGGVATFLASIWSDTVTDNVSVKWYWFTAGGSASSTVSTTGTGQALTASPTPYLHTVSVPSDAVFAAVVMSRTSGTSATAVGFLMTRISVHGGAGGFWAPPGRPSSALSTWVTETATTGRAAFVWDQINGRAQMVYYDSGWRDISSLMVNGWTGSVFLRRADNQVFLRFAALSGVSATADTVVTLPAGFRSESTINAALPANASDDTMLRAQMTSAGAVVLPRAVATAVAATWPMSTTNALPATLPGTASGTIPAA